MSLFFALRASSPQISRCLYASRQTRTTSRHIGEGARRLHDATIGHAERFTGYPSAFLVAFTFSLSASTPTDECRADLDGGLFLTGSIKENERSAYDACAAEVSQSRFPQVVPSRISALLNGGSQNARQDRSIGDRRRRNGSGTTESQSDE